MGNKTLYNALIEYGKTGKYPLHMPGHKRNIKFLQDMDIYDIDITEIEGFDNLHYAEGIIKEAMDRATLFYGTKKTWFLVNGSTCGIQAAIASATNIGDKVLVGRNCHKSVYNALGLRNLSAEYIYPEYIEDYGIYGGYSAQKIKEMLERNSDIKAVIITSPTYEGIVSDIEKIAEVVHKFGAVLIVDEAHGAHFILGNGMPKPAYKLGADIVIESLHKTLPAMTQTAVMHLAGERISKERLEEMLDIFETSSPSYVMMASIEQCISIMEKSGKKLMDRLVKKIEEFRKQSKEFSKIRVSGKELVGKYGVFDVDITKLVLDVGKSNISGKQLADILRDNYQFEMEMDSLTYALAICTICDDMEQIQRLLECLGEIYEPLENLEEIDKGQEDNRNLLKIIENEQCYSIYEAKQKEAEKIDLKEATGWISKEFIYLYPPGIPIVVPGERISNVALQYIEVLKEKGFHIQGLRDKGINKIEVVKNILE